MFTFIWAYFAIFVLSTNILVSQAASSKGDMELSSMTIVAPEGKEAHLILGSGETKYSMGIDAAGQFELKQGDDTKFLSVSKSGNVILSTKELIAAQLSAKHGFRVGDVSQWYLWKLADFSSKDSASGWTVPDTSVCGGIHMLGGYNILGHQGTKKTFSELPDHSRIRITGVFHFIDFWQGETAYMKISSGKHNAMEFVWTDRYELTDIANAVDICGDERFGEGKFSVPFDISLVHAEDTISIEFGSTLPADAEEGFFGISGLEILLRTL